MVNLTPTAAFKAAGSVIASISCIALQEFAALLATTLLEHTFDFKSVPVLLTRGTRGG